jgi:hypothetical protein
MKQPSTATSSGGTARKCSIAAAKINMTSATSKMSNSYSSNQNSFKSKSRSGAGHSSTRGKIPLMIVTVLLSGLLSNVKANVGSSFNFEISKRTEAAVRTFMQPPVMVNEMSNNGYAVGAVKIADVSSVRKWEFTQLISFKTLYMVYAGFENGFFTGYIRGFDDDGKHVYKYTERTGSDNSLPGAVRKYWWSDSKYGNLNPNGLGIIRNRTYDHRARGWYKETKEANEVLWSSIYAFASTNELGLTHCQPVYDSVTKEFSGVLAVDYTLGNIDKFLTEEFSKGERDVFMVEHNTGLLVASSTLDPLLRVVEEGGKPERVPAVNSTDKLISSVSKYLDHKKWPETLVVHEGNYIQVKNYKDGKLNWDIVVVMPADSAADNILPGSGTYLGIIVIVFIGVLINAISLIIMIIGKEKNIWKAAQPMFLGAFAMASIFVNMSTLAFTGENTISNCLARPWVFNLAFTSLFAILFVKVHRVNALFNNKKMKKVRMGPMVLLTRVSMIVGCELVIQIIWTIVDPNTAVVKLGTGPQGEFVETVICQSNSPAFAAISIGFKAILILWGCILAWKTRNVHGAFAESKQIMMIMYQIGFLSLIVLLLYYFLNVSSAAKVLIQSIVVLCVSLISAILLFGTRIFQLYSTGDIDLQEIVRQQTMMTSQTHMQHTYDGGNSSRVEELEDEITKLKAKLKSATITPDIEVGGNPNNRGA